MQPSTASLPPSVGVAVVEDSAMLRELIEEAIEGHPDLHLTGSARTMREAVSQIPWRSTQFATIDLQLPDGVGMESPSSTTCAMSTFGLACRRIPTPISASARLCSLCSVLRQTSNRGTTKRGSLNRITWEHRAEIA